ncbi:MAG: YidC/Oxa1 family membrane protein insertase [Faecalicatena sp.]|uniref:YidC/Oxa1 family membrane protein insertase n=1 Tax=Faecalicatena sp. TaxID=2005360 RepID=UPI0025909057|nr:YidC/Oxa1 family membrane protein insertase [Faecalicatena sp.]MCI6466815.1 YidC/Oxa1 family membrane protein insertase [Faecalicatena sp.]MCI7181998.1 YidC/Oxa1 family membrane protein insertase [Lachnospiraceae bacterium]MDY5619150.1 YidC/Oxa1 family membrane protein insertase [Lachnospiraceae bacterium]
MYGILAAGYADWPIIHQISWLLGKVMNGIYNVMDGVFGVQNIGICIIIFTIIVYTLMIPLTIKQQKWSKMSSVMNPEIQKIQKKYANKKDQASMLKQQEELQTVYEKYGTSPTGGCLPMLIQMPVLFALYPVIQNIPNYVQGVKNVYMPVVNQIMAADGFQKIMEKIGEAKPVLMSAKSYDYSQADTLVNVLYKFQDSTWNTLVDKIPSLKDIVETTTQTMGHLNSFLGINIGEAPFTMLMAAIHDFSIIGIIMAAIIPVMAGLTQFISVKLQPQPEVDPNNQMANSMKTMTYTMPLFSVFMGFTLPAGLGLYWAISAVVRCVQQLGINKYLSKKSTEELIAENQKKAAKKREKKGTSAQAINKMATTNTRNVEDKRKSKISDKEREERLEKAAQQTKNAKPGSLSSKANLVSRFNSGQSTSLKDDDK